VSRCSVPSCAVRLVRGSDLKEHLNFPNYVDHSEWNLLRKYWPLLRPPLWSSGQSFWLQIQRSRVGFPALPDFLRSSGFGTGSTQPREDN
jgi:hypothetical protein